MLNASTSEERQNLIDVVIPPIIRIISGCDHSQTSFAVFNEQPFQLSKRTAGAGGACTSALLRVLNNLKSNSSLLDDTNSKNTEVTERSDSTFRQVILQMGDVLKKGQYAQVPQLTSSCPLNIDDKFNLVPPQSQRRHALLIGINYQGQQGELRGSHNCVMNMKNYLLRMEGFLKDEITVLMDDNIHNPPTKENILKSYSDLVANSKAGDAILCHFSGHGGRLTKALVPVDFLIAGHICDDEIYRVLVGPMKPGVTLTYLMDCCHGGPVMDLPYKYRPDKNEVMAYDESFNMKHLLSLAISKPQGKEGSLDHKEMNLQNCVKVKRIAQDYKHNNDETDDWITQVTCACCIITG